MMKTLIIAMTLLAVPALADGKLKEACAADAAKLCPGLTAGKGLGKCLHEHAGEVTPACSDALAAMHGHKHQAPGSQPPPPAPAP